jgi:hypothetical protein
MPPALSRFLSLSSFFLGLTVAIPTLFKQYPFVMLPLLGISCILLMRQNLMTSQDTNV